MLTPLAGVARMIGVRRSSAEAGFDMGAGSCVRRDPIMASVRAAMERNEMQQWLVRRTASEPQPKDRHGKETSCE